MNQTIITLDSTQIKEFLTCEHKWLYAYVENLRKFRWIDREKAKGAPVDKGSYAHKLLEVFYTFRALNPQEDRFRTQLNVRNLFENSKLGKAAGLSNEEVKFIFDRFLQYVMKWSAYDFVPQMRNGVPGVELGFTKVLYEDKYKLYLLEGKIDLVSKTHSGGFDCFVDHKTQDRYSNLYGHKPQFKTYALATGFNYGMVNYFKLDKTYKEEETFRRAMFYFSDEEIAEWKTYLIEKVFNRIYSLLQAHKLEKVEQLTSEMLAQNFSSCAGMWEINPCPFTLISENKEKAKEIKKHYYFKVPKWSPWTLEEESEEAS